MVLGVRRVPSLRADWAVAAALLRVHHPGGRRMTSIRRLAAELAPDAPLCLWCREPIERGHRPADCREQYREIVEDVLGEKP